MDTTPRRFELRTRSRYSVDVAPDFQMCARLIFATLIGLMLCSIATIETSELLRLADDTSNDFSLPNVPRQAASIAVAEFREPYPLTAPTLKGQGRPNFRPQTAIASAKTSQDILRALCIIRT
jgi:hypothetical protein